MQAYMDTLHATERIKPHHNHTAGYPHIWWTGLLKAGGLVHGHRNCCWHSYWDPCTHLAESKSCGVTHTLIHEATQAGKCWDEIMGILRLKLCNANIPTYTSCFMEIQQKDYETLAAYFYHFKTAAKQWTFDNDTVAICIFVEGIQNIHTTTFKLWLKSSDWLKTQCSTTTYSHTDSRQGQYDVQ